MEVYEAVFIFPPESAAEARKSQLKSLDDLFAKFQGEIIQKTEWGKRPLGYPVRKFREGYFLLVDYKMDPARATEFRKALELQEELLKFMNCVKDIKKETKAAAKLPAAKTSHAPAGSAAGA